MIESLGKADVRVVGHVKVVVDGDPDLGRIPRLTLIIGDGDHLLDIHAILPDVGHIGFRGGDTGPYCNISPQSTSVEFQVEPARLGLTLDRVFQIQL